MELSVYLNKRTFAKQGQTIEQERYAHLYQLYAGKVYNSVYRIVNNYALAEDIMQDAFCTAFEDRHRLKETEKFEGWVKRIALNKAVSYLRKNKLVFLEEGHLDIAEEDRHEPEDERLFLRKIDDIKTAIHSLPDGYRTIVVLYLFDNISQEDIAAMLNISHSTVRTQYHRAKKKILSILKQKYDEEG